MVGYQVGYWHKGFWLTAGNPETYPEREIAEKVLRYYKNKAYMYEDLLIKIVNCEPRYLSERREFNGKKVVNLDWYYGIASLEIGDYVEDEVINMLMNIMPPRTMSLSLFQIGEPANHICAKPTWETFKRVSGDIWEYCGDCFVGKTERR